MADAIQIREKMEVVGSDDQHVGEVDRVEGDSIKLTRRDPEAGGKHHYLSMELVDAVEGDRVRLNIPANEAKSSWEERSGEMRAGGSIM
ncbi:MAG: DUF2171 domain-containing protein [Acidobacteria bacterium]|nr:DUF2171 domain-containing protein [Acidobacteriota bacterium]